MKTDKDIFTHLIAENIQLKAQLTVVTAHLLQLIKVQSIDGFDDFENDFWQRIELERAKILKDHSLLDESWSEYLNDFLVSHQPKS